MEKKSLLEIMNESRKNIYSLLEQFNIKVSYEDYIYGSNKFVIAGQTEKYYIRIIIISLDKEIYRVYVDIFTLDEHFVASYSNKVFDPFDYIYATLSICKKEVLND